MGRGGAGVPLDSSKEVVIGVQILVSDELCEGTPLVLLHCNTPMHVVAPTIVLGPTEREQGECLPGHGAEPSGGGHLSPIRAVRFSSYMGGSTDPRSAYPARPACAVWILWPRSLWDHAASPVVSGMSTTEARGRVYAAAPSMMSLWDHARYQEGAVFFDSGLAGS
jgi:hypothetical protein